MMHALVACIGNPLAADDGVGWHVYKALSHGVLPGDTRLVHAGLAGLDLLELFDAQELCIIVDAARTGALPGTVAIQNPEETLALATAVCSHDIGFVEAWTLCRHLFPERCPRTACLITIETAEVDVLRPTLSACVATSIPEAVAAVIGLIRNGGSPYAA